MASRKGTAEGARGPCDLRSNIGCMKTKNYPEVTGDLAPVYQEEGEQGQGDPSRSERDMEFVRQTMLTTQVQNVIVRIEMVAQDHLIHRCMGDGAAESHRAALQMAPHGEK
jgi:hypothetical protein